MENKKGVHQPISATTPEVAQNEAIQKHSHQHNTQPQHLRLLQYGLKIPNHQHALLNQSHSHQLNSPLHLHMHQQVPYQQQQVVHRHLPSPSSQLNSTPPCYHLQNTQQYIHQHQQNNNRIVQQQNQPLPPPLHPHTQLVQNSPQIWVPHQPPPPIHYHHQQNKTEPLKKNNVQQQPPQRQQQTHAKLKECPEKKKSGNITQLRSPSAKRPPEAPVTMQGWLYKQGSDGLMLWKKRWFVLSEYCLFYYKSPEEEKLLGSILLPSYKVSICSPEDKVNKKFAFKCEHANMRTYVLAADSQELMLQWIRVLNLACLLQSNVETTTDQQSEGLVPVVYGSTSGNSDYHQHFHPNQASDSTPVHMHSSSNTTELSNPSQQDCGSHYNQPLYANAPPKPRRLNDGSYTSSSPDVTERYSNSQIVQSSVPMMRNVSKSPLNMYGHVHLNSRQSPQSEYVHHRPKYEHTFTPTRELQNIPQTTERRTPDTYGRSKLNPVKSSLHPSSDYEDVYADHAMYKRPLSPIAYSHVKKTNPVVNPSYRSYTPVHMFGPPKDIIMHYPPPQMRKSPVAVERPHSADFLEYELNHRQPNSRQQPRPKSSLDINRYTSDGDNYFYSEERYAEKMRRSAQYLPKMPKYYTNERKFPVQENNFVLMRSNTQPMVDFNNMQMGEMQQPVRSRSVLSEGSLSKELDVDLGSDRQHMREAVSPAFRQEPQQVYNYDDPRVKENDQFTRSASARLATHQNSLQGDGKSMGVDGDRKREESMKRLLEWKQRMLQSPLNRKVQSHRVYSGRPRFYFKNQENEFVPKSQLNVYSDERTQPLPQYNSYSSDDEDDQLLSASQGPAGNNTVLEIGDGGTCEPVEGFNTQQAASGSISLNTRDTFPKAVSSKRMWSPNPQSLQSRSVTNLSRASEHENFMTHQQEYILNRAPKHQECVVDNSHLHKLKKENWSLNDKMNVSAGELLGRTHEELVLLLIQLRRQNSNTLQAIENCYNEIDTIQAQLHGSILNQAKRLENLQKLEQIKQHLIELEKQYEKGKPLVNLVDNMVKLGSLYRSPHERTLLAPHVRDRLEFNQQIQERRLLAEEKRDWNRLNLNHTQLQEKVQQLYRLDKLIQEESGTLQNLQQDKEDIEKALGGLKHRLNKGFNDPAEIEEARKQQVNLENELSRVHLMLAQNSKKLEETVAGNARLEQELLILKQKLQMSRQQRSSPQFSNAGDSLPCATGTTAMLESDLQRVQQKVGDLQKQRQELSLQVRQLTDRSNSLQQQIKHTPSSFNTQNYQHPSNKKKVNSFWRETDLDTMSTTDHGDAWDNQLFNDTSKTPLYINTDPKQCETDVYGRKLSDSTSDDNVQNPNLTAHEKQEIKTVRIVKRESERRQRDREKSTTGKWDALLEEDNSSQNSSVLFRPSCVQKPHVLSPTFETDKSSGILSRQSSLSSPSLPQIYSDSTLSSEGGGNKSPELSPIFKSEAARQIITEMSKEEVPKFSKRRAVPKEKRRHYTAPHNNFIMKSLNQLPTDENAFVGDDRRARDDLDMERALRQRIDAPDVVRSTLSSKELKYNENTIDNILGTPNKISIPERYIPEQLPQLSVEEQEHRLRKVESIKKMLSDAAILSTSSSNLNSDEKKFNKTPNSVTNKATSKMIEEKKQREHLLQLNQILAKQVMEMSKIVAGSSNPDEQ